MELTLTDTIVLWTPSQIKLALSGEAPSLSHWFWFIIHSFINAY